MESPNGTYFKEEEHLIHEGIHNAHILRRMVHILFRRSKFDISIYTIHTLRKLLDLFVHLFFVIHWRKSGSKTTNCYYWDSREKFLKRLRM
jgi:hypothetical protein